MAVNPISEVAPSIVVAGQQFLLYRESKNIQTRYSVGLILHISTGKMRIMKSKTWDDAYARLTLKRLKAGYHGQEMKHLIETVSPSYCVYYRLCETADEYRNLVQRVKDNLITRNLWIGTGRQDVSDDFYTIHKLTHKATGCYFIATLKEGCQDINLYNLVRRIETIRTAPLSVQNDRLATFATTCTLPMQMGDFTQEKVLEGVRGRHSRPSAIKEQFNRFGPEKALNRVCCSAPLQI